MTCFKFDVHCYHMDRKVIIGNTRSTVILKPSHYLTSGGEAEIFCVGNKIYKLYFAPEQKKLTPQKMMELKEILDSHVVIPQDIIYDFKTTKALGYTMDFIDNTDPILRIFNKAYKVANNIDLGMVSELVKQLQIVMSNIHIAKCLAVDFNELNILIELGQNITPWVIDTDSFATPSYKASAVMSSIQDRKATTYDSNGVMHYHPDIGSDWFSWAVITFWIYVNLHPYRPIHPNYKAPDRHKQMDDGINVFTKGIRIPPTVENFNVIPKRHLDWYKLVFENGERSIPPMPDGVSPMVVPTQVVTITGTDKITIEQVGSCGFPILSVQQFMGVNYIVTKGALYSGDIKLPFPASAQRILFCTAAGGEMVIASKSGHTVEFTGLSGQPLDSIKTPDIFERNGAIYTITNGALMENTFTLMGSKLFRRSKEVSNVSNLSAKMYPGCVIQDLLGGRKYFTLPYVLGKAFTQYLPGLDKVRIVDAKADKNVIIIIGETGGQFNRYVIVFDKKYENFEIRETPDIAYEPINMAVLDNGLCMLFSPPDEIQLFSTAKQYETLDDPPFDSSMPLFATPRGFFIINGNTIHQIKRK